MCVWVGSVPHAHKEVASYDFFERVFVEMTNDVVNVLSCVWAALRLHLDLYFIVQTHARITYAYSTNCPIYVYYSVLPARRRSLFQWPKKKAGFDWKNCDIAASMRFRSLMLSQADCYPVTDLDGNLIGLNYGVGEWIPPRRLQQTLARTAT